MSSNNNDSSSNFDSEKLKKFASKFGYYFDIFYRIIRGFVGFIALVLVVIGMLGGGAALGYFASLVEDSPVPTKTEIQAQVNDYNSKSTLYYADNSEISDLRSDLLRTPITLDGISPLIVNSVIAIEDENFPIHEGIVPKAIVRAAAQELSNAEFVSGGSTLTQQLIKQQMLSADVTHSRKAIEILYATHLENNFSKDEIMEAYLNVSPFGRNNNGQNIAGIEEAAQGIFGVSSADVNLPQAAFLAGLPQSPIVYSPYTQYGEIKEDQSAGLERQRDVLYSMFREGYISEADYQAALDYDIVSDFKVRNYEEENNPSQTYEYDLVEKQARDIIMNLMLEEDGITPEQLETNPELADEYYNNADFELRNNGYKVFSTIDKELHQKIEQRILETNDQFGETISISYTDEDGETYTNEYPTQVGGTLVDNSTGKVLAFVGGRDYDYSNFNVAFDSRRHSGSVIKPLLVFGPALAENLITPATSILDNELLVPNGDKPDHPIKNFASITNEWRDARYWLAISQNIPNTKIYLEMFDQGMDPASYIRKMGIGPDAITDEEFANASSSIGGFSYGPTATELAGAYAAIGNKGVFNAPYVIEKIEKTNGEVVFEHEPNPTRVWSETTNYLLYDMLRDVLEHGSARMARQTLNFNTDLAAKTGTSDETVDVWFAGVTPKVSLVTWMGYEAENVTQYNYNGLTPSQRNIRNWGNILNVANSVRPELIGANQEFTRPADNSIVSQSVLKETGMKPGKVSLPGSGNRSVNISGETKTEIFARDNVPGTTKYDFSVYTKPDELKSFWDDHLKDQQAEKKKQEDKKKREEEKKKQEEEKKKQEEEKKKQEEEKKKKEEEERKKREEENDSDSSDSDNNDNND